MANAKTESHILAFGDSLTEGYYEFGMHFHPYELKLQELLAVNGFSAKVHQAGRSGECVIGEMEWRLPQLLQDAEAAGVRYSWVVILGGINDIGGGADPSRIFKGLQSLYEACRAHGARVLALTCLQTAFTEMDGPRKRLNEMIRGAATGSDRILLLDADKLLPYPRDPSDAAGMALWDDGLHLRPAGYDALGQLVFEALRSELGKA